MHADPVAVLRRAFGYPGFRPGQEELVRAVLDGRDALGVLPTGGGKSVCYQVPALILEGLTLVITPLVSLMEDQVGRARAIGLGADCLSGTQPSVVRREVGERARSGRTRVLFVSPERLDVPAFRELLDAVRVDLVAVDEAHCISEWGHDFRPAYRKIGRLRGALACPVLALTASATPEVRADILANLGLRDPLEIVRSFDRPNLWWGVPEGGRMRDRLRAVRRAVRATRGVVIVYAPTRRAVETVRDDLAACGHRADAYHAGLRGEERSRVQERFMAGESRVVVATNAFGMGIDKADVRTVVHVQLPATLESYYQEAGRAGRDGEPSMCVAFHGKTDRRLAAAFIDRTHPPARTLRRVHRALLRGADRFGIVRLDDPGVVRALEGLPREFMEGEPVGPLGALERIGAIRRLIGQGAIADVGAAPPDRAPEATHEPGPARPSAHGCEIPLALRSGSARPAASVPPRGPDHPRGPHRDGDSRLLCTRVGVRSVADHDAAARLRRRSVEKLKAVQRYARERGCRRNALLRYFGEASPTGCGQCDGCGWDVEGGV
jgi:ATP-dependent DNA helicase RecQ